MLRLLADEAPLDVVALDAKLVEGRGTYLFGDIHRISPQTTTTFMTGGMWAPPNAKANLRILQQSGYPEDLITAV